MSKVTPIIKVITICLLISIIYVLFIFSNVSKNEFLLIHDHLVWFNSQHLINESFIRMKDNSGLQYGLWSSMSIPNRIVYTALFSLGLSLRTSEMVFFTLVFTLLLSLSYIGFYRLNRKLLNEKAYYSLSLLLGVSYFIFNSHISHNINTGNFFNIGFVLAFVSLPNMLYHVVSCVKDGWSFHHIFGFLIWVFFSINYLVYFVPIVLTISGFLLMYFTIRELLSIPLKKFVMAVIIGSLLTLNLVYGFYINQVSSKVNATFAAVSGSTDGMIKDGLLTMIFQRFSWAMYVDWLPKSILTFSDFYFSPVYLLSLFVIIMLPIATLRVCKDLKTKKLLIIMSVLFLVNIFLAKGSSEPLGSIYRYLVTYFPPFLTVRSPDNKFSVGVVFCLTEMLYLSLIYLKSNIKFRYSAAIQLLVLFSIITLSIPVINLKAVLGEDIKNKSGKFITSIPNEYLEVINVVNKDPYFSNVLVYPPSSLPNLIHNGRIFIGKDLLGSMSNKPFYYLSYADLTDKDLLANIKNVFRDPTTERLNRLGVKYIIYRKDTFMDGHDSYDDFQKNISHDSLTKVLIDNNYFILYEVRKPMYPSFVNCTGTTVCNVRYVSPVEQVIEIPREVEEVTVDQDIIESKYWSLSMLDSKGSAQKQKNLFSYIMGSFDDFYDKGEEITSESLNELKKNNTKRNDSTYIRVYFEPQKTFYLTAVASYLVLSILIIFTVFKELRDRK